MKPGQSTWQFHTNYVRISYTKTKAPDNFCLKSLK